MLRIYLYDRGHPEAAVLAIRYLVALPWMLKSTLRGEGRSRNEEVLKTMFLGDNVEPSTNAMAKEYEWAVSQDKPTVAFANRIRQICAIALLQTGPNKSSFHYESIHLIIEERLRELETVVGGCSRLFTSPIPPMYSRHLSRVMTMWLFLTPMSLIASGLPTTGVALATTASAYVLIGLDEVGMEIEGAFKLLPLQQLCGITQNDVRDAFLDEMPQI